MRPHLRRLTLSLVLCAFGCKMDDNTRMLTVRNAVVPSTDCSFMPTNAAITQGFYDPWVNSGGGATFAFVVENFISAAEDEPVAISPTGFVTNADAHRHDAQIEGIEGCFFLTNGLDNANYTLRADGSMVDCQSLPEAQRRLELLGMTASEGSKASAQRRVVVSLRTLSLTDLRQLFGDGFDPSNIPVVGEQVATDVSRNSSVAGQPQEAAVAYSYSYTPQEPVDVAGRSATWGAKYPQSRQARVVLQLRARARLLSGGTIHSNWYNFPVEVCPGCMRDMCGALVQKVCGRGVCTDGTPCMSDGSCAAGSPVYCTPISVFSGSLPNFAVESACLMAQNYPGTVGPTCEDVGCDATN